MKRSEDGMHARDAVMSFLAAVCNQGGDGSQAARYNYYFNV